MSTRKAERPVGATEVAELLGVQRTTVEQWGQRPSSGFPAPEWTVGGRPAWRQSTIMTWARETGRVDLGAEHPKRKVPPGREAGGRSTSRSRGAV